MPESREFDGGELEKVFLHRLGLRVGPETAAYVARRLAAHLAAPQPEQRGARIPVMAASARTGVPVRTLVGASELLAALPA